MFGVHDGRSFFYALANEQWFVDIAFRIRMTISLFTSWDWSISNRIIRNWRFVSLTRFLLWLLFLVWTVFFLRATLTLRLISKATRWGFIEDIWLCQEAVSRMRQTAQIDRAFKRIQLTLSLFHNYIISFYIIVH